MSAATAARPVPAPKKKSPVERVRFSVGGCDLGRVLLAATDAGVCAVSLGDADEPLETWLREEFPAAELVRDDAGLAAWLTAAVGPHPNLPLDLRGTAFQRRVWDELRKIPRGETRTYGQVAAALGVPDAVRAVARACATNPASLVVPCHRVVGADGSLRGYRWGVGRKQELLDREAGSR